jgi:hypothetical protein
MKKSVAFGMRFVSLLVCQSARSLNAARKGNIRQRHTGPIIKQSLEEWREYFEAITKSDFLMGRVDGQRWRCDFDFAVSDRGMTRKYHG